MAKQKLPSIKKTLECIKEKIQLERMCMETVKKEFNKP
jgi:hypothetical protein